MTNVDNKTLGRCSAPMRWLLLVAMATLPGMVGAGISEQIRHRIELYAADMPLYVAEARLHAPREIVAFYVQHAFASVWVAPDGDVNDSGEALLAAIDRGADHGLAPSRYHRDAIEYLRTLGGLVNGSGLELLLTDAFIAQTVHRTAGLLDPQTAQERWLIARSEVDPIALLERVAKGTASAGTLLSSLWPEDPVYAALLAERRRLLHTTTPERPPVAAGPILRRGMRDARVQALRDRLDVPATGESGDVFDAELEAAVVEFQRRAGLEADGAVGALTLSVLNLNRAQRLEIIAANLERMRWLPRVRPPEFIEVNIANFSLTYMAGREPLTRMNVIVGRSYRQTPIFVEDMRYLVLNPFWEVPRSIAARDKLPQLREDAAAQAALGFEAAPLTSPGQLRSVAEFEWHDVPRSPFPFRLRQRPGPDNALGTVKFMMPNPHNVYLHDTPSRELFGRTERAFSSGCIRVERPLELVELVLRNQPGWDRERIERVVSSGQPTTVMLRQPLPVYLVYFTAFADDDDAVHYRRDIYERDRRIIDALYARAGVAGRT
jgi:L,D-transpeptidase YcbB